MEREATTCSLKTRSVRSRDDKAFMVKKDDFDAFCTPPKLDDNIEEGLLLGQKSGFGQSKINVSSFHKELDSDFRRIDNSARTLFRAISYGTMISAFLDEAECEDDRVEGRKALINCFRSMADLTARTMANSVLCRRKVFLKNVDLSSKATEKKLLQLPIFGGQLFNGQYFDSLHTSAGASVAEWLRRRSHTTKPLTSSPRQFESHSYQCDCVRKFVSLIAKGRWSLPKYIV